jgi:hypothetical protein
VKNRRLKDEKRKRMKVDSGRMKVNSGRMMMNTERMRNE